MVKTRSLEAALLEKNAERAALEAEYARLPLTSGRTLKEKQRKLEVEARTEQLAHEISAIRLQLKKLGVK